tara:strand:- start:368 stop:673 length:306 start_codon:yes stop_codon:yes gene_type:complete
MGSSACLKVLLVTKVDKGVKVLDAYKFYIASATAVTTIWSTKLDILLSPKARAAVTAITTFDKNLGLVEEFHFSDLCLAHSQKKGMAAIPLQPYGEWRQDI